MHPCLWLGSHIWLGSAASSTNPPDDSASLRGSTFLFLLSHLARIPGLHTSGLISLPSWLGLPLYFKLYYLELYA